MRIQNACAEVQRFTLYQVLIMAQKSLLLPICSHGNHHCYEGYISAKGGVEYRLRLTLPSSSLKEARLECDWKLRNLLRGHEITVQKRLSESANLDEFLLEMKTLVNRLENSSLFPDKSILPSSSYCQLMEDLDKLGWERVTHVGPDLMTLKLNAHDSLNRKHILTLNISSQYPSKPPSVSADVPLSFKPLWTFPGAGSSLLGLLQQFEQYLLRFEPFWKELDEIDRDCWVLEPENPTRACMYRRIVIGENLSMHMVVEALSPTIAPQLTFLGADQDVLPLVSTWNSSIHNWDEKKSILHNLRDIFSISFPPPPKDTDSLDWNADCAICYAYRLDGHTPSVVCSNRQCGRQFHNQCLYDWLWSLQTVTSKYFNKITGNCPFCDQLVSSTAPT